MTSPMRDAMQLEIFKEKEVYTKIVRMCGSNYVGLQRSVIMSLVSQRVPIVFLHDWIK
jgi:hypothetical protein